MIIEATKPTIPASPKPCTNPTMLSATPPTNGTFPPNRATTIANANKAITTAVTSGANTPSLVYKSCGAKPQCGSCSEYIKQEINQSQTNFESNLK